MLGCADGYRDIIKHSNYCFKRVNDKKTWEDAKHNCSRDNGNLACYHNHTEIIMLADSCKDCWLGYFWENGKFIIIAYLCIFL